jgi:hypothetical protein
VPGPQPFTEASPLYTGAIEQDIVSGLSTGEETTIRRWLARVASPERQE